MRRSPLVLALMAAALGLAACGGGSNSTSGTTATTKAHAGESADSLEATWAKEVRQEMSYFENHVSAQQMPAIQDTYAKVSLEPLYRAYAANLAILAHQLETTKAPTACTAARAKIAGLAHRVAALTKELSDQPALNERQYSLFLGHKGEKIRTASIELTELTARPSC